MLLEAYQFMLICSVYEITLIGSSTINRGFSLAFAFLIFIMCIKFTLVVLCMTVQSIKYEKSKLLDYFEELFSNGKTTKAGKLYSLTFICRTLLLVTFLLFGSSMKIVAKLIVVVLVQLPYLTYQVICRPIESIKDCFLNIINETLFLCLACVLMRFNSPSDWNDSAKYGFIGSLTATSLLSCILHIASSIRTLVLKVKKCRNGRKVNYLPKNEENNNQIDRKDSENRSQKSLHDNENQESFRIDNRNNPKLIVIDFGKIEETKVIEEKSNIQLNMESTYKEEIKEELNNKIAKALDQNE